MSAARVMKEHEERKNELLDVAQELFYRNGYDDTSVNAIIEKAGVSKGTFYHYFSSKDELLDCLGARVTDRILGQVRLATADTEMDAITRFNTFFIVAGRWKAENPEVILMLLKALYRDQNVLLRHKIMQRMVEDCVPEIAGAIRQGIEEKVFHTADAEDAAELIMQLSVAMRESTAALFLQIEENPDIWPMIERKLEGYQTAIERVLAAPKGSIVFVDEEAMESYRTAFTRSNRDTQDGQDAGNRTSVS